MLWSIGLLFFVMLGLFLLQQKKPATPRKRWQRIALKCAATGMAVIAALLGCLQNSTTAHWVLLAGLIICTLADGVLCVHFTAGGALFALGHLCYMAAFFLMQRPSFRSLVLFACLMGACTSLFTRWKSRIGHRYVFFYAYAMMLCLMVAFAAVQTPLYFTGAIFFFFSDVLLGYLLLDRHHTALSAVSLGAYYLGQFILAVAVIGG